MTADPPVRRSTARASALVAAGILLSRVAGLVRVSIFARYFGQQSDAADAFNAAFRIPNVLQNLFGEGALSASFIPVYARLLAQGREEDADRVARTIFVLLSLVTAVLVLFGVVLAPYAISLIAPGFTGDKRTLTTALVRILFPGAGLLVVSAWCLGVLNSHRKFFISYTAPVVWNAAMIGTLLIWGGGRPLDRLAIALAIGSVIGSALQFAVQLPAVLSVFNHARPSGPLWPLSPDVRTVVRNFGPAFVSRGVVQLSAYIDTLLASLLPTGAVTALMNAQVLYTLPVSLFGISISAAELPAMSGAGDGTVSRAEALRQRITPALENVAFFVIPSATAFLAFGDVIAAAILQHGRFRPEDATYVWGILAGSAVGLLASTMARLYSAAYYALGDTRTPLRFAVARVVLVTILGYLFAIVLPPHLGIGPRWGAAGLTASAGIAGWCEFALLRHSLNARIGGTGVGAARLARLWAAAAVAAAIGWQVRMLAWPGSPIVRAVAVLGPFGVAFIGMAAALRVPIPAWRRR
ncbi:MAG: murein biosynthesis integral membrane protein MurJ [Acidobacteriota bacterium]